VAELVRVVWTAVCRGGIDEPCEWAQVGGPQTEVQRAGERHQQATHHAVTYEGRPVRDTPE
jgi:hypothetical protein